MPNFTQHQLQKITTDIFAAGGVPSDDPETIGELLVASNLEGHDSVTNVIHIPQYIGLIRIRIRLSAGAPMHIERVSTSHALLNGNWGLDTSSHGKRCPSRLRRRSQAQSVESVVYNGYTTSDVSRELRIDGG